LQITEPEQNSNKKSILHIPNGFQSQKYEDPILASSADIHVLHEVNDNSRSDMV